MKKYTNCVHIDHAVILHLDHRCSKLFFEPGYQPFLKGNPFGDS